ncbi:MAG TPA: AMP-binding protein [Candidatus Stercoripulliclostridium merdigallinarum]|uniref:AMP-binding protein n=1 Tax=Candidatus Stercoripulliclostridium merdigallinarum TaxID=2840951 RepID=A0A9D1MGU1_9FIRM|nr:AMP-binding protein [Candidatus Stercoripulliclostridium merdigallinarum]
MNITVGDMLSNIAKKYPTKLAVKYIEVNYTRTYYEFNKEVDKYAKGLLGMGIGKGDHVAIWATNYPEWLILFFATARIGAVLVTVNTNYKEAELEYLLSNSDSKALFICDGIKDIDCEKIIYSVCPELKTSKPGELHNEKLPFLRYVVSLDNWYDGMYNWSQIPYFGVLISNEEFNAIKHSIDPDDVVNMQYTSGTTGFPKGVMLTHNNIVNNGKAIGDCMKFSSRDKLCIPVPFFHCFGMVLAIMAAVTHGAAMVPLLWYTPMKVMHAVEYEKCTAVHGVPTMFIRILEHRDFSRYDFSSLRTGIMAGSPCPVKVMRDVVDKMHMSEITITYGQTEASPACTMTTVDDPLEIRVNTVGKEMPFMETKIVDPDTGEDLPDGTPGEFVVRGYNVMKGYYKMPEATAAAIDKDGWLHTGDLAIRDSGGYYRITGRIKDMIIRGGENIFPKEIEDFIYTHPDVVDVQIVGVPSEKYGEEAYAFVIKRPGSSVTEKDIQTYVANNMARHKVPSYVEFIDQMPMTASGKIQKFVLRDMAKAKLNRESSFVFKDENE